MRIINYIIIFILICMFAGCKIEFHPIETLQQTPQQIGQYIQRFLSFYWGGIGFTAGPPYVGIVICLLAFIGFSNPNNKHKWWWW